MDPVDISAEDRKRYARLRAEALKAEGAPSALVRARYDAVHDTVDLTFRNGVLISIPRELIPEFDGASKRQLGSLKMMTHDAIECAPIDTHHYVPGLVEAVMGTRFLAAVTGRRGGQRRSKIKAAAARANGALGGRPRKRQS